MILEVGSICLLPVMDDKIISRIWRDKWLAVYRVIDVYGSRKKEIRVVVAVLVIVVKSGENGILYAVNREFTRQIRSDLMGPMVEIVLRSAETLQVSVCVDIADIENAVRDNRGIVVSGLVRHR